MCNNNLSLQNSLEFKKKENNIFFSLYTCHLLQSCSKEWNIQSVYQTDINKNKSTDQTKTKRNRGGWGGGAQSGKYYANYIVKQTLPRAELGPKCIFVSVIYIFFLISEP